MVTNGGTADTTALDPIDWPRRRHRPPGRNGEQLRDHIIGGYATATNGQEAAVYLASGGVVNNGSTKDTTARIVGTVGAYIVVNAAGTINNFGTMGGASTQVGAVIGYGGAIVNGGAGDTTALIQGYVGTALANHPGTVTNFGTIRAGGGPPSIATQEAGVLLQAGGSVINGSSADTKALIGSGVFGVYSETIAATVTNFGTMSATAAGVVLKNGGKITNGSATDTTATISGDQIGAAIETVAGTVSNFGTIDCGPFHGFGVALIDGGVVTNGSSTDHAALIEGFAGVEAPIAATVTNFGTIRASTAAAKAPASAAAAF